MVAVKASARTAQNVLYNDPYLEVARPARKTSAPRSACLFDDDWRDAGADGPTGGFQGAPWHGAPLTGDTSVIVPGRTERFRSPESKSRAVP